ncbi:hypothetical protein [Burkholderia stagnalis]
MSDIFTVTTPVDRFLPVWDDVLRGGVRKRMRVARPLTGRIQPSPGHAAQGERREGGLAAGQDEASAIGDQSHIELLALSHAIMVINQIIYVIDFN